MLFDPFKKQFHGPPRFVDLSNDRGRESEVVGKEPESLFLFHVQKANAAERIRVNGSRLKRGQDDGVIGTDAGALIDLVGVAALQQDVGFGAHYEEGGAEGEEEEAFEIHVRPVHDVESSGLRHDLVQDIYVVHSTSVMRINVGILPRRSNKVCILTAALYLRNFAHGNKARHKSMVVESNAYRV